jgi:cytosine/adenosine deaminase-related metal-dependent hydrolase
MATLGGAQALGLDSQLGSLDTGKKAALLAVSLPEGMKNSNAVLEYLTGQGKHLLTRI